MTYIIHLTDSIALQVLVITQLLVEKVDSGTLGDVIDLVLPFFAKLESRPGKTSK